MTGAAAGVRWTPPICCLQRAGGEMLLFANIRYFLQIAPRPRPEPPGPVGPDAGATRPTPAWKVNKTTSVNKELYFIVSFK